MDFDTVPSNLQAQYEKKIPQFDSGVLKTEYMNKDPSATDPIDQFTNDMGCYCNEETGEFEITDQKKFIGFVAKSLETNPKTAPSKANAKLGEIYSRTMFFYLEKEPDHLFHTVEYTNYRGLDTKKYFAEDFVKARVFENALMEFNPKKYGVKDKVFGWKPNKRACDAHRRPVRIYFKPWERASEEIGGILMVNLWNPPVWWRYENNELCIGENLPKNNESLIPIEWIIEALFQHTLEDQQQISVALSWFFDSLSQKNQKVLCIFGYTRTGKSLITETLFHVLHGDQYHYFSNIGDFFLDQFSTGTIDKKTAIAFPEIGYMDEKTLKKFLNFVTNNNISTRLMYKITNNLSESRTSITINANLQDGQTVFPQNRPELMARTLILIVSTQNPLLDTAVTISNGKNIQMSEENIMRILAMAKANTDQGKYDAMQFILYLRRFVENNPLNLSSSQYSGYIKGEEGIFAIKNSLNSWQQSLVECVVIYIEKKSSNIELRELNGEKYYYLSNESIRDIIGDFDRHDYAASDDYKRIFKRKLSRDRVFTFFMSFTPQIALATDTNKTRRKLAIRESFIIYIKENAE